MGLLDKIMATLGPSGDSETPARAKFATRDGVVYAPASGMLMSLREVNDEVVSAGLLGEGYAIVPVGDGVVYAPVNGRIAATTVTNHSIGLLTEDGIEIVIHVGIGTVNMNGKGFERFVEVNDAVKAGTPLIRFDRAAVAAAGYEDVVVVAVSNADEFSRIDLIADSGTLLGDRPLVKLGDPLMAVHR